MEETHPIWHTPAVQQAATAGQFGALIRMTRMARGLTLVQVGDMVGYSASTLSRIETGQRKLTDVTQLRLFANALDIPPHLLGIIPLTAPPPPDGAASSRFAVTPNTVGPTLGEGGDNAVQRRQLLAGLVGVTGAALLGISNRPPSAQVTPLAQHLEHLVARGTRPALQPVAPQVLRDRLATAHATFHACRYHELAVTLPDVIATAEASLTEAAGQQHGQTSALLADAYSLASNLCIRLHDDALAWVTAERARTAAQTSGDVFSIAGAARRASIAMRRHGHHDTAITLLTTTALDLCADSGDPAPELLATYGSLLCTASYTAAQNGNRHRALELIGEAETAATRLGEARAPHNPFSPTNVAIYQIGVHTALGDAGTALDHARKPHTLRAARVGHPQRRRHLTARVTDRNAIKTKTQVEIDACDQRRSL